MARFMKKYIHTNGQYWVLMFFDCETWTTVPEVNHGPWRPHNFHTERPELVI